MPQDATCPKCTHLFPVTEARQAFTVACPKCDADMTVEFKKPLAPPEAGQPPYDLFVRAGALPGAPAPPAAPPKRKVADEDDDEPKRKGGSALIVLLSGGLGLLFVAGGLALTGWILFTQIDMTETVSNRSNNNNSNNNKTNNTRPNTPSINKGNPVPGTPNPGPAPDPFVPPKKKEVTFDLRPVNGPLPMIGVPDLPADVVNVDLGGRAEAVAVGGGGRYLVLHIPSKGQLALFDASTADLTFAEADRGDLPLAAGAGKVVLGLPGGQRFRAYSLPDLRPQGGEMSLPPTLTTGSIAIGSRTDGPMLVADVLGRVVLIDIAAGRPVDGSQADLRIPPKHLRAAADGKSFLASNGFSSDRVSLLDERMKKWQVREPGLPDAYLGADGRLYGKGKIASATGTRLAGKEDLEAAGVWFVPAVTATGNYFLRVSQMKNKPIGKADWASVGVHRHLNVDTPVFPAWEGLPEAEGLTHPFSLDPLDQRVFLIPEAKLLIFLNRDRTKLTLRKVPI